MVEKQLVRIQVNGKNGEHMIPVRNTLADFLRDTLALTGTHAACEHGVCGACHVRLNGQTVRSCLLLAVQADQCRVETVEALRDAPLGKRLQDAFVEYGAFQCGFCTPGMLFAALDLVEAGRTAREEIREGLSGNICRCTGYQPIVDAIQAVAKSE